MIGTRWPGSSCARIARVAAKPSMRGIRQSIRTAAKPWPPVSAATASTPSAATSASKPAFSSMPDRHHLVDVVVLDHEDPLLPGAPAGRGAGTGRTAPRTSPAAAANAGGEPERAAAARARSRRLIRRPCALDELAGDGEAEPGAAVTPGGRGVGLGEGVEEPLLRLRAGCPGRCRRHRHQQLGVAGVLASTVTADADLAAVGELHRVGAQVGDHLAEPRRVAAEVRRHLRRDVDRQREPLLVGLAREAAARSARAPARTLEVHQLQLQLAGLDLREVEDVVDDRAQRGARRRGAPRPARRCSSSSSVRISRSVRPMHAVHRGPDLVAHRRQELRLHLRGLHGLVAGLGQLGRRALPLGHPAQHAPRSARRGRGSSRRAAPRRRAPPPRRPRRRRGGRGCRPGCGSSRARAPGVRRSRRSRWHSAASSGSATMPWGGRSRVSTSGTSSESSRSGRKAQSASQPGVLLTASAARSRVSTSPVDWLATTATCRSSASRRVASRISWSASTLSVMSWSVPAIRTVRPEASRSARPRPRSQRMAPSPRTIRAFHSNSPAPVFAEATSRPDVGAVVGVDVVEEALVGGGELLAGDLVDPVELVGPHHLVVLDVPLPAADGRRSTAPRPAASRGRAARRAARGAGCSRCSGGGSRGPHRRRRVPAASSPAARSARRRGAGTSSRGRRGRGRRRGPWPCGRRTAPGRRRRGRRTPTARPSPPGSGPAARPSARWTTRCGPRRPATRCRRCWPRPGTGTASGPSSWAPSSPVRAAAAATPGSPSPPYGCSTDAAGPRPSGAALRLLCGGQGRGRTADLSIFSRSLVPTELPGRERRGTLPEVPEGHETGAPIAGPRSAAPMLSGHPAPIV